MGRAGLNLTGERAAGPGPGIFRTLQHRPCPRCGSARIHRSRRRTITERTMSVLGVWTRRCHDCGLRFVRFLGVTIELGQTAGR
jgi:predicted RNA-binding Zn-ribbon protein involved in translation (DUF1610 family)